MKIATPSPSPMQFYIPGSILKIYILALLVFLMPVKHLQAQQPYNRLQYGNKERWLCLPTTLFRIYYQPGCDSLASFASLHLPDIITEIKQTTGQNIRQIPNLIIYPSVFKLYESNIGIKEEQVKTFPTISLTEARILLAFNGSYQSLRQDIKKGLLQFNWESAFEQPLSGAADPYHQKIPEWFKLGAIRYFTEGWPIEREEAMLQQILLKDSLALRSQLAAKTKDLYGQAFCYFLETKYRRDAIKQLYYQLRSGKSLSRAARLVLKRDLALLDTQCLIFYQQRARQRPDTGLWNSFPDIDSLALKWQHLLTGDPVSFIPSKDRSSIAVITETENGRKVFLLDWQTMKKPYAIIKKMPRLKAVVSYPLPPWLPNNKGDLYPLVIYNPFSSGYDVVMPQKGKMNIIAFSRTGVNTATYTLYGVDGVVSAIASGSSEWLLSAFRKSNTDLVIFDGRRLRYRVISKGLAEYSQLAADGNALYYRSGYPADSLRHRDTLSRAFGIYRQELSGNQTPVLLLKDTLYYNWQHPTMNDNEPITVTGTINGWQESFSIAAAKTASKPDISKYPSESWLHDYYRQKKVRDSIQTILNQAASGEKSFLRAVLTPDADSSLSVLHRDSIRQAVAYQDDKVSNYVLQLHNAYFSASINNDYYINRLQPYAAYLGTFKFPEVSAMVNGGFSDLFERHHLNLGYRMPAGTEGSDFFVRYGNTASRLDWHLLFFRKVEQLNPGPYVMDWKDAQGRSYPTAANVKTHFYELGFGYPFNYQSGIDFSFSLRSDKTVFLATSRYSLEFEALHTRWGLVNISPYINRLQQTIPMLYKGWEAKLLLDGMLSLGNSRELLYGSQLKTSWHQPLFRHITLVTQIQAGYSGGSSKILYNFGGVDNNIVPRTDTTASFVQQAPYAFQTLIAPMRGYRQNSAYSSNFALANLDIYVPLFQNLIPYRPAISALRNLQLSVFADVLATGPVYVLPEQSTFLLSYGVGARTLLAGYPVSFNLAWPGSFARQPVWYLSLGLR